MAPPSALEIALRNLALAFANRLVTIACSSSIDGMSGMEVALPRRPSSASASTSPNPASYGRMPPQFAARMVAVDLPSQPGALVLDTSLERAYAMEAAVRSLPWAARSRELQSLLGLSKTQFIRIAMLAIRLGLVHRTGQKAGMQYHLGPGKKATTPGRPRRYLSRSTAPRAR